MFIQSNIVYLSIGPGKSAVTWNIPHLEHIYSISSNSAPLCDPISPAQRMCPLSQSFPVSEAKNCGYLLQTKLNELRKQRVFRPTPARQVWAERDVMRSLRGMKEGVGRE